MRFSPSLACADQLHMGQQVEQLLGIGMDLLHFDIMDGHYVPNLCLSMDTGKQLKQAYPQAKLDVHLMVTQPEAYVERMAGMGAERVAFHVGATSFARRTLLALREKGMQAGLVVNPSEPLHVLDALLPYVDFVLLMSIEPGFAGQQFLEDSYGRVRQLAQMRKESKLAFDISVDGGITPQVARQLFALEADTLVLGYPFLFQQPDGIVGAWQRNRKIVGM